MQAEMMAQGSREPKPASAAICSTLYSALQQTLAVTQAFAHQPLPTVLPVSWRKCRVKLRRLMAMRAPGYPGCGFAPDWPAPSQASRQPGITSRHRQRLFDELRLPALPMWRHHQPPRHAIGQLRAITLTQQMQAAIQPGGSTGRSQQWPSSTYSTAGSSRTCG
jgi:hypothetical protein